MLGDVLDAFLPPGKMSSLQASNSLPSAIAVTLQLAAECRHVIRGACLVSRRGPPFQEQTPQALRTDPPRPAHKQQAFSICAALRFSQIPLQHPRQGADSWIHSVRCHGYMDFFSSSLLPSRICRTEMKLTFKISAVAFACARKQRLFKRFSKKILP